MADSVVSFRTRSRLQETRETRQRRETRERRQRRERQQKQQRQEKQHRLEKEQRLDSPDDDCFWRFEPCVEATDGDGDGDGDGDCPEPVETVNDPCENEDMWTMTFGSASASASAI
jgi:hypothetical protein